MRVSKKIDVQREKQRGEGNGATPQKSEAT